MPELPEVETVRRGLERTILGKTVAEVHIHVKKLFSDDPKLIEKVLVGAKVVAIERRAKVLLIGFSTDWTLAIHLKMTGQLIVVQPQSADYSSLTTAHSDKKNSLLAVVGSQSAVSGDKVAFIGGHPEKVYEQPLPHKHTHVIVTFTDGTVLYFNDLRKFGWLRLFPQEAISDQRFAIKKETLQSFLESLQLGPEPLSPDFTLDYLAKLLQKRSIPIKQLLLEQKGISGIGNIYADEALFRAGIHPTRKASSLQLRRSAVADVGVPTEASGRSELERLHRAIQEVLELGIEYGGTSKNTYRNVEGTKGEMQKYLMVYGREDEPCRFCGTPIERQKIGSRSSHFCSKCQK